MSAEVSIEHVEVAWPGAALPEGYWRTRFATLREPLGSARGAERLKDDHLVIHAWVDGDGGVVAVGRVGLIDPATGGEVMDHGGDDNCTCPAFPELLASGSGPVDEALHPAVRIRQMGTDPDHRRQGHAARVLAALEAAAVEHWGAVSCWMQAREAAVPFYASQGYEVSGEPHVVGGIGPHRSMWKSLSPRA